MFVKLGLMFQLAAAIDKACQVTITNCIDAVVVLLTRVRQVHEEATVDAM